MNADAGRASGPSHQVDMPVVRELTHTPASATTASSHAQPSAVAQPGDVIVGYKEDRTADPDALAAALKAAKPGDEASLDYVRQANVLTRIVTLGEWE